MVTSACTALSPAMIHPFGSTTIEACRSGAWADAIAAFTVAAVP